MSNQNGAERVLDDHAALQTRAAAELGCDPVHVGFRLREARWSFSRLALEIQSPGLAGRLEAAITKAKTEARAARDTEAERALAEGLSKLFGAGPSSMLALDVAAAQKLMRPRLAAFAAEYSERDGGAVLCGPTGIGKTLCANLVVRRLAKAAADEDREREERERQANLQNPRSTALHAVQWGFAWVRAMDLATARSRHALGEGEAPIVQKCVDAHTLLVLDDLGWETRDGAIADVVAARYDAGKVTLVTTGLTPKELEDRYGAAFVRRIVQSGGRAGKVVNLFGKGAP